MTAAAVAVADRRPRRRRRRRMARRLLEEGTGVSERGCCCCSPACAADRAARVALRSSRLQPACNSADCKKGRRLPSSKRTSNRLLSPAQQRLARSGGSGFRRKCRTRLRRLHQMCSPSPVLLICAPLSQTDSQANQFDICLLDSSPARPATGLSRYRSSPQDRSPDTHISDRLVLALPAQVPLA